MRVLAFLRVVRIANIFDAEDGTAGHFFASKSLQEIVLGVGTAELRCES